MTCQHRRLEWANDCDCEWYRDCDRCVRPIQCAACKVRFASTVRTRGRVAEVTVTVPKVESPKPERSWSDLGRRFLTLIRG